MAPTRNTGLKEAYLASREAELKEWDAEITQLVAKAEQAPAHFDVKHLKSLAMKQAVVHEKLQELKQASGAAWETVKIGLEHAWHDLKWGLPSIAAKYR